MTVALDSVKDRAAQNRNLSVDTEPLRIRWNGDFEDIAALVITRPDVLVELASLVRVMEYQWSKSELDKLHLTDCEQKK